MSFQVEWAVQEKMTSQQPVDWDKQPLGQFPDAEIARMLGCFASQVRDARRARNIPRFQKQIDWDRVPFGQFSDYRLARMLGCCLSGVTRHRVERGIPAFAPPVYAKPRKPSPVIQWEKVPLGQQSDSKIARALGVSINRVQRTRAQLKIRPFGRNLKINWEQVPFGAISDGQLARQLGCSKAGVQRHRVKQGKPSYSGPARQTKFNWDAIPLGTIPDEQLARELGCCSRTVFLHRSKRGIPPAGHAPSKEQVSGNGEGQGCPDG